MQSGEQIDVGDTTVFDELRPVCFMHIGKVGGHSICQELLNRFPVKDAFNASPEQYDELDPAVLLEKRLIIGHFSYCHSKKLPHGRFLFSMVRDPIDRVMSNYWYLRTFSGTPTTTSCDMIRLAKAHDFSSFVRLENLQVRQVVENHQCMFFADDWRGAHRRSNALLSAAIGHLDEFDFIGIHERYDESMQLLAGVLGWLPWPTETKLNVTPYRESVATVDPATMEFLRSANELDLKLYDEIKSRYDRQKQRILIDLVRSKGTKATKAPTSAPPLIHDTYADLPFNGEGWSIRFIVSGHYARWMHSSMSATFLSELDQSNGGIATILIVGWRDHLTLDSLTLDANDIRCHRISIDTVNDEGPNRQQAAVSFRLPPSPMSALELRLTVGAQAAGLRTDIPQQGPVAVSAILLRAQTAAKPIQGIFDRLRQFVMRLNT